MKTALITGAVRGIGRACAEALAGKGYGIIINYRESEEKALCLKAELESNNTPVLAYKADVTDYFQAKAMIDKTLEIFGRLDIVINNAGASLEKLVQDTSEEEYIKIMDTNVKGVFNITKACVPVMVHNKSGSIVNISSIWGVSGGAAESVYSASKSAVIGFTKALAKELGPSGIRVNCIAPGFILTDMTNKYTQQEKDAFALNTPLCRLGTVSDVAKAAVFLASEESSFITGQVLCVDGGAVI